MEADLSVQGFTECLALYERERLAARNLSPKTRREYLPDLAQARTFLESESGLRGPFQVDRRHLEAHLAEMDRRGLKGSSRRRKVASLKSFFSYLFEAELIRFDPAEKLVPPAREHYVPRVLSESEHKGLQPNVRARHP